MAFELCGAAATHVGCFRTSNQDSYLCAPDLGIWAIADGMGGYFGGERASALVVKALKQALVHNAGIVAGIDSKIAAVRAAIADVNGQIFREAQASGQKMGSTVVALVIENNRYAVLWAGDSRAYLLRGARADCLTRDHSQAQELVSAGLLDPGEARSHPLAHILVRAIGVLAETTVEHVEGHIVEGDMFLLSSDGLHNLVTAAEIIEVARQNDFDGVVERLIELGLERGAPDNITICMASVRGSASAQALPAGSL